MEYKNIPNFISELSITATTIMYLSVNNANVQADINFSLVFYSYFLFLTKIVWKERVTNIDRVVLETIY
jgi:hypothetical protein